MEGEGKCVGVGEGRCGEVCWGVGVGEGRGVGKCRGKCGKMCWGLGEERGKCGESVLGFPIPLHHCSL